MPKLLLEVGCEELPATFVRKAYGDLLEAIGGALREAGLYVREGEAFGTPRRLIVAFDEVLGRQPDSQKEVRGPSVSAAYKDGAPTGALLGFCKGQGIDASELTNDGQYVWFTKHIAGRDATEVLAELLPKAILSLSFEKSMRWGSSRLRFARPIRWIVALLDSQVIPFSIESVTSGNESRGHRFYSPAAFTVTSKEQLITELEQRKVAVYGDRRAERIVREAKQVASGEPEMPAALIEENAFLTEWPTAIRGEFSEHYLELPEPVLVTAMAKHERMFPVRGTDGKLKNEFVFIRNSGVDEDVRRGSAWVLNARFNDALFFYRADQKFALADFHAKTSGIIFQAQLGTVLQRSERLENLAEAIAQMTGANSEEATYARTAARYAKADLSTGLVSELSSLQGVVGGEYARREGHPEAICEAIAHHYDVQQCDPKSVGGRTALRVLLADQLDKLAGYLGLGLEPTGSSDPFGLRKAVTMLIEAAWKWPGAMPPYDQCLEAALAEYAMQGFELNHEGCQAALCDIFLGRYSALLRDVRKDILDAAMLADLRWELTMPQNVLYRTQLLSTFAQDLAFVQTATRPLNIVAAAKKKGIDYGFEDPLAKVDASQLNSDDAVRLLEALRQSEESVFKLARERDRGLESELRRLAPLINAFFDNSMVMSDNESERYHRLTLAHAVALQLLSAGDFTKLAQIAE